MTTSKRTTRRADGGTVAGAPVPPSDPHPWRVALVLTALVVAYGMVWGFWIWPHIKHVHHWLPPPDIWHGLPPAHYVVHGDFGSIYASDRFFVAGPLFAVFLAPVAWADQVLHLAESYPVPVDHPTAWLVYGPWGLVATGLVLYAVRALATEAGVRRGRHWLQIWTLVPLYPVAIVYGHYEDVLALGFVMLAFRDVLRTRSLRAALLLGVGVAVKQWALLAVPLVVALAPAGRRVRTTVAALVVPGALAAFTLAVDWPHASKALFRAATFPQVGEAALWVSHRTQELVGTPSRLGTFVVAFAVAWRLRGHLDPAAVIAGLGVTFTSRLLFEPTLYSYYAAAGLAFLLLHEKVSRNRYRRTLVFGTAWLFWFEVWPATWWWWAVTYLALAILVMPAVREVLRARPVRKPALSPEATA
jgi:hypothetical protein